MGSSVFLRKNQTAAPQRRKHIGTDAMSDLNKLTLPPRLKLLLDGCPP
jgi:hypothetical protein